MNELWENKIPDFDQITVPAYVVASYSNTLHTAGTFRAWRRIASAGEVAAHPQQPGVARLLRRGERRGPAPLLRPLPQGRGQRLGADAARPLLGARPRGRRPGRPSPPTQFPPDGRHLDEVLPRRPIAHPDHRRAGRRGASRPTPSTPTRTRCRSSPASTRRPCWSATRRRTSGSRRGAPTTWTCSCSCRSSTRTARRCRRSPCPTRAPMAHDLTDHGATILRYKGSDGRLRVSARHLDEALSTDDVPAHSFDRVEKLARRRDRRDRDRPAPDRPGLPPRRAAALRHQLPQPARHADARDPRVRRRQQRAARHPHRRRARLLPAAPRPNLTTTQANDLRPALTDLLLDIDHVTVAVPDLDAASVGTEPSCAGPRVPKRCGAQTVAKRSTSGRVWAMRCANDGQTVDFRSRLGDAVRKRWLNGPLPVASGRCGAQTMAERSTSGPIWAMRCEDGDRAVAGSRRATAAANCGWRH